MRLTRKTADTEHTLFIDTTNYQTSFTPFGDMVLDFTSPDSGGYTWFRVTDLESVNTILGVISNAEKDLLMTRTPQRIWIRGDETTIGKAGISYTRVNVKEWRYPS